MTIRKSVYYSRCYRSCQLEISGQKVSKSNNQINFVTMLFMILRFCILGDTYWKTEGKAENA